MADEITPRFNLVKPEVGGSADTWGDKWNENADKIDANALNRQTDLARHGGAVPETNRLNVWESDQRFADERALVFRPSDDSSAASRGGMMWESTAGAAQFRVSYQHSQGRLLFFGYGSGGSDVVGAIHKDGAWVIGDGNVPAVQGPGTLNAKNGLYDGGERVVRISRTISAGTGLTGGGNLSANRTISLASSHYPIGVGQTWQDVTAQRAVGTTYTNTTGRPIMVAVMLQARGSVDTPNHFNFYVDNVHVGAVRMTTFGSPASSTQMSVYAIVPAGSSYRVASIEDSGVIMYWTELR